MTEKKEQKKNFDDRILMFKAMREHGITEYTDGRLTIKLSENVLSYDLIKKDRLENSSQSDTRSDPENEDKPDFMNPDTWVKN